MEGVLVESHLTVEGFLTLFKDRDWVDEASCRGLGPDLFFPEQGAHPKNIEKIKEICSECPVRQKCREYGEYETHGFWGGVAVRERQNQRSLKRSAEQHGEIRHGGCEVA